MSDQPATDKLVQVRAFALWTEYVAKLLNCSYADAATFLVKLNPFLDLMRDTDFQEKLARFWKATAAHPFSSDPQMPQSKGIH